MKALAICLLAQVLLGCPTVPTWPAPGWQAQSPPPQPLRHPTPLIDPRPVWDQYPLDAGWKEPTWQ